MSDKRMAMFSQISQFLSCEMTREWCIEATLASINTRLPARTSFVLLQNAKGDFVPFPQDGESAVRGREAPIDLLEEVMAKGEIRIGGGFIAIPLQNKPAPFGVLVIQGVLPDVDAETCQVLTALASGILCCGDPPKVG